MTIRAHRPQLIVFLLVMLFGLVGCNVLNRISGDGEPPPVVLSGAMVDVAVDASTYCWNGLCADGIYPPVIAEFVELPAGGPIALEFDGSNPATAFLSLARFDSFPEGEPVSTWPVEDVPGPIEWTTGAPAGKYVLSISAKWPDGDDAAYQIGVIVP